MSQNPAPTQAAEVSFVRSVLQAAGIAPTDAELEALAAGLPGLRARVAALYAVDCADGEPAAVVRALEEVER